MKVRFKKFESQKRITGSINPDAHFDVTSKDGEWLKLNGRHEVHHSEVTPVKTKTFREHVEGTE